jgi:hypothetical protein
MNDSPRLNTRLPRELWRKLRSLAASWGCTHDDAVRRLIAQSGGDRPATGLPSESGAEAKAQLQRSGAAETLMGPTRP